MRPTRDELWLAVEALVQLVHAELPREPLADLGFYYGPDLTSAHIAALDLVDRLLAPEAS